MDALLILYILNLLLNTAIILLDILVMFTAIRTGEVRRQLVIQIIFLAMAMDIPVYLITMFHDVPSFILKRDILPYEVVKDVAVLFLCGQWFSQLFVLLALSFIHFVAVFAPSRFRGITPKNITTINIMIVAVGLLFTVPMYTPYCGYAFFTDGYIWYFDMSKPYTYVYWTINIVLQVLCVIAIACVDGLILWKICNLRSAFSMTKTMTVSFTNLGTNKRLRVSREMRLAINFLFLSVGFLVMTICYNLLHGNGFWYDIAMKLASNLNLSKWAIYCLGNSTIRKRVVRLFFRCDRVEPMSTNSVATKTEPLQMTTPS
ncbi:unnamed protein product [Heligmosomoides polygyrus]|uniref:7TM_GPCR_Srx domain-containing protein n=1 Tax=Heligmosomoides polygyrus TaxID=6339 RepID=A0A183FKX9_HELPZ|nr:unnamed protein product [Heligmosomoides polygyrus]